ncbi:MAG TPA: carboxypeptidase regulatory-like domain-containing protein, partial [Anaeromyxobacteraceae bacterium]|nr:carboxypeptidase regulatory-like domain-containing protein [Anaeromyxobacteraceae bacterium]
MSEGENSDSKARDIMQHVHLSMLLLVALFGAAPAERSAARIGTSRSSGAIVGTLRYKGCTSAPLGVTVSVIGRDTTALADADGRFILTLPPGTYSLVIGGPGLVPDQRVDGINVVAGQAPDLGTIEVWPEERPPSCTSIATPVPIASAVVATAPDSPALELPGPPVAPISVLHEQVWTRGGAGSLPGEFAFQGDPAREDEDALGPTSFAIGPQGSLWVLDGLNGRLQHFDARGRILTT